MLKCQLDLLHVKTLYYVLIAFKNLSKIRSEHLQTLCYIEFLHLQVIAHCTELAQV